MINILRSFLEFLSAGFYALVFSCVYLMTTVSCAQSVTKVSEKSEVSTPLISFEVVGDSVPNPLGGRVGVAQRGEKIIQTRDGQCTLCHAIPGFKGQVGNLGPLLEGVGTRLTSGQIRLRIINSSLLNTQTIMPSYYKVQGLENVDPKWRGIPIMNEQQIEDVVTYLVSLKETQK